MEELQVVAYKLSVVCALCVKNGDLDSPVLMFVSCFDGVQRLIDSRETNSESYFKILKEELVNYVA